MSRIGEVVKGFFSRARDVFSGPDEEPPVITNPVKKKAVKKKPAAKKAAKKKAAAKKR